MSRTTLLQERRMQTFQNVLGHWQARRLSALEAAEMLGMSERSFRRYRRRYEDDGLERIVRPKARQGVRAPRAGRPDRMGARAVPEPPCGLDGQALPRPSLRPPWLRLELHLDQDHLAARRPGVQGTQARRPPSPAPAQALRRHDAPSGRLTP